MSWYPLNDDAPAAEIKHTFELVDHRAVAEKCLAEALAISGDDNTSGWGLVLDTPAGGADHWASSSSKELVCAASLSKSCSLATGASRLLHAMIAAAPLFLVPADADPSMEMFMSG